MSYLVTDRDADSAFDFLSDLAGLSRQVQLTSDGWVPYPDAVSDAFNGRVDYAQLVKIYGPTTAGGGRYSPPACPGAKKKARIGLPNPDHISTRYVERQNLTMRMSMRRFTRLLKKTREPRTRAGALLRVLQLLPHSKDAQGHPGHSGWPQRSAVVA